MKTLEIQLKDSNITIIERIAKRMGWTVDQCLNEAIEIYAETLAQAFV